MRTLIAAAALGLALAGPLTPALAHPGGHEQDNFRAMAGERQIRERAAVLLEALLERKAIEPSWKGVAPSKLEYRTVSGHGEWLVTFNNDKAADKAKRVLYIMLDPYGDYIASNHTGV
jgi:hypothetical protein